MFNTKVKMLAGAFAAAVVFSISTVSAFAGQVDFETFVNSVRGGEFVLSPAVESQFFDAVNDGNTERAMEIYKDFFDGDDGDGVAYKRVEVTASSDASDDVAETKEEVKEEADNSAEEAREQEEAADIEASDTEADVEASQEGEYKDAEPQAVQSETPEGGVLGETAGAEDHYGLSDSDYLALCKIVYAEAHTQGEEGMLLIANVILNRVRHPGYPATVLGVISQPGQFGPVRNGRFAAAVPDAVTISAVNRALSGENHIPGALYFKSARSGQSWGNRTLVASFGNHSFYI